MLFNPRFQISCIIVFFIIMFFSSCSGYMAAQKGGVPVDDITRCKTRAELLSIKDVEVIETVQNDQGEIEETCRILKETGSYGRAAFNTFMTVFSLGVWEMSAYPMETSRSESRTYYNVKVYYDKEENIKKIDLLNY